MRKSLALPLVIIVIITGCSCFQSVDMQQSEDQKLISNARVALSKGHSEVGSDTREYTFGDIEAARNYLQKVSPKNYNSPEYNEISTEMQEQERGKTVSNAAYVIDGSISGEYSIRNARDQLESIPQNSRYYSHVSRLLDIAQTRLKEIEEANKTLPDHSPSVSVTIPNRHSINDRLINSDCFVATTEAAHDILVRHASAGDNEAILRMAVRNEVFVIKRGTAVRIISGVFLYGIEVLDGPQVGRRGYLLPKFTINY